MENEKVDFTAYCKNELNQALEAKKMLEQSQWRTLLKIWVHLVTELVDPQRSIYLTVPINIFDYILYIFVIFLKTWNF